METGTTFLRPRRAAAAAFSLLETLVALGVFTIATLGVTEIIGTFNRAAALSRAVAAAKVIVDAKVNKLRTVIYDVRSSPPRIPLICRPNDPAGPAPAVINQVTVGYPDLYQPTTPDGYCDDPYDAWGAASGYPVNLVADPSGRGIVTGNVYALTRSFDPGTNVVQVTFTVAFLFAGKTYLYSQTTLRAPDEQ